MKKNIATHLADQYKALKHEALHSFRRYAAVFATSMKPDQSGNIFIHCEQQNISVTADYNTLMTMTIGPLGYVRCAIKNRLNGIEHIPDFDMPFELLLAALTKLIENSKEYFFLREGYSDYRFEPALTPDECSVVMVLYEDESIEFDVVCKTIARNRKALGQPELDTNKVREILADLMSRRIVIRLNGPA